MAIAFMIPLGLVIYQVASYINEFRVEIARRELVGLEYSVALRTFVNDLQRPSL